MEGQRDTPGVQDRRAPVPDCSTGSIRGSRAFALGGVSAFRYRPGAGVRGERLRGAGAAIPVGEDAISGSARCHHLLPGQAEGI